jgi:hypothetical protein
MHAHHQRLAMGLTYAGVLPVWVGLGASQFADIPWVGSGMLAYGAIIVSFVCGMHWATFMNAAGPLPINLLVTSNLGALSAWGLMLISPWSMPVAFLGLAAVLGMLLGVDRLLFSARAIEPWFWMLRRNASIGLGAGLLIWAAIS